MKFAKTPAPKMITRPISPAIASRWRMKRRRAYDHWLRALISSPASTVESSTPAGAGSIPSIVCSSGATVSDSAGVVVGSVIADPRIQVAVDHVGDQVEHDDDHRGHDEVRHHRVVIRVLQALDEVIADPVEREDRLRDDRAAEQSTEVERGDRHDRDEGVPEDMAHDHAPFRDAFGACGPYVVAVDHVEHRRAHVSAVQREADDAESRYRQCDVL